MRFEKAVANVIINMVMPYLKEKKLKLADTKLTPALLCELVLLIDWGEPLEFDRR